MGRPATGHGHSGTASCSSKTSTDPESLASLRIDSGVSGESPESIWRVRGDSGMTPETRRRLRSDSGDSPETPERLRRLRGDSGATPETRRRLRIDSGDSPETPEQLRRLRGGLRSDSGDSAETPETRRRLRRGHGCINLRLPASTCVLQARNGDFHPETPHNVCYVGLADPHRTERLRKTTHEN